MTRQPFASIPPRSHRGQQGAATLIVVMLLFFIISMVAAYTSRNLIFEQRTSANQYRTTQAFEASEAGLEWALAQLNAGRITNTCTPSTDDAAATHQSFAQRYLAVDAVSGVITPRAASSGGAVQPRCVFDSSSGTPANWTWNCACPVPDAATAGLTAPGGTGPAPAFALRLRQTLQVVGARTDLVQLEAISCTRLDNACLTFPLTATDDRGGSGDGVAATNVVLALRGALTRPPAGALTVAGTLADLPGGATLMLNNQEATASGLTLHTAAAVPASGPVPTGVTPRGLPGTPPASTTQWADSSLAPASASLASAVLSTQDRRFAQFFGVRPATYFGQPGMAEVDCSAGCAAADINLALLRNPGRAIRVLGAGALLIDANIGTAAVPALLIVEGDVTFAANVTLVGMIYGRKPNWSWTVNGAATIVGAAVAEDNLTLAGASGAMAISYDKPTLTALRVSYGTFVRVPGSWKDFQ